MRRPNLSPVNMQSLALTVAVCEICHWVEEPVTGHGSWFPPPHHTRGICKSHGS